MGTCYYLIREDNQTLYELGKTGEWHRAFSDARWIIVDSDSDHRDMVESLCSASERVGWNLEELTDVGNGEWITNREYIRRVFADIVRWSDGQWFEFISEHDGRYERLRDRAEDAGEPYITGTRFVSPSKNRRCLEGLRLGGVQPPPVTEPSAS